MKYKNLFFDLDGTLTDSGEGIMKSVAHAFERLGMDKPSETQLREFVGPPLRATFMRFGVPENRTWEAVGYYRERYNSVGKFENRVYDGIEELLKKLVKEGYGIYVATSKPEPLSREIIDHFGLTGHFRYIAGATPDCSRETKSDVLRYLLSEIGGADSCLMIGDTVFDILGAAELGIPGAGVSWGYGNREEMLKAGAIAVVGDCEELYRVIAGEISDER